MEKLYQYTIDENDQNQRLDVFLTKNLQEAPSRTFIKKLIDTGKVSVNQKQAKAHYKILKGDQIVVNFEYVAEEDKNIKPENIPLNIFYQDQDLIVIHKPIGLMVHPATGNYSGTLVNALLHHFKSLSDVNGQIRPGIVHRLDRETSGLILAAKNNKAHVYLARQFEKHKVYKKYIALVQGNIAFDQGVIEAPIRDHPRYFDLKQVAFDGVGREAVTYYEVLKRYDDKTLVALYPQTGRTHQLRVHLKHLGHPILGDDKYGRKETFSRLALHAQIIGFLHPATRLYMECVSQIPEFFYSFDK